MDNFTLEQILELISQLEDGAEILELNPDSLPLSADLSVEEKVNKLLEKNKHLNTVWQLQKKYSAH